MTVWSNHSHKKQGYVKIAPGKNLQEDLMEDGSAPIALYYVPSSKVLTVSLSEEMIKRAIDRSLLRRKDDTALPAATWSGQSSAFFAKNPLVDLVDGILQRETLRRFRKNHGATCTLSTSGAFSLAKRTPSLTTLRSGKPNFNARGAESIPGTKSLKLTSPASSDTPASQACQRKDRTARPFWVSRFRNHLRKRRSEGTGHRLRKSPAAKAPELD